MVSREYICSHVINLVGKWMIWPCNIKIVTENFYLELESRLIGIFIGGFVANVVTIRLKSVILKLKYDILLSYSMHYISR